MKKNIVFFLLLIGMTIQNVSASITLEQRARNTFGLSSYFCRSPSISDLAKILTNNLKNNFTVQGAFYGTDSNYITVSKQVQNYANQGILLIPQNMNNLFEKDPAPGIKKKYVLALKINKANLLFSFPENCAFSGDSLTAWNNFKTSCPLGDPTKWQFIDKTKSTYPYWIDRKPGAIISINAPTTTTISTYTVPQWIQEAGTEQSNAYQMTLDQLKELGVYCNTKAEEIKKNTGLLTTKITDYFRFRMGDGYWRENDSIICYHLEKYDIAQASIDGVKAVINYTYEPYNVDPRWITIRFKVFVIGSKNSMYRYFIITLN